LADRVPAFASFPGFVWLVFKREDGVAVNRATQIRLRHLAPLAAQSAVNTFQWAKVRLALNHPAGLEAVQRFKADSKFFRSLVPLLLILPLLRDWKSYYFLWLLIPLALWRYMEQRHKATKQAYWFLLALEKTDPPPEQAAPAHPLRPMLAGGVVYRKRANDVLKYLFAADPRRPDKWALPKGLREPGEESATTMNSPIGTFGIT